MFKGQTTKCVLYYDGTISTRKVKNKDFIAKICLVDKLYILYIKLPEQLKGIVKSIVLKYILNQLKTHFNTETVEVDVVNYIEFIPTVDNEIVECLLANDMNSLISSLEKHIKDFDKGAYNEKD